MSSIHNNHGKSNKDIYYFATYGICFVALGLGLSALGPMLPFLAKNVDVSFAQISFLFTTSSLGYLLGSAGGGRLFDRYKGHQLMLFALLMMALMMALVPITSYFLLLLAIMFFLGIFQGSIDVGGNVNLLWVYQGRVGPYMNALHFCFGVGAFLSPVILHHVMRWSNGQITWPFWTIAVLTLPGMFGLWTLSSPENPEKDKFEEKPNSINTRLVVLLVVLFFLYVGVETGFGGWIFTYATQTNITSQSGASYMNSIFWGALTLGRLLSVPLARKIVPSRLLLGNFFLAIMFLGLILVFPINTVMVWVASAGLGLALSSVFPTLLALGESRMKISGKVTGYFFLGSSLGATLIPMALGQIFEYVGSFQIMLTLFILTIMGLIVLSSLIFTSNKVAEKVR